MAKIYVAFGSNAEDCVSEHRWTDLRKLFDFEPQSLGKREFKTDKEVDAYVSGLFDALGWSSVYVISKKELECLSGKIRLSEIPDLAENG